MSDAARTPNVNILERLSAYPLTRWAAWILIAAAALLSTGCVTELVPRPYRPSGAYAEYRDSLKKAGLEKTALGEGWIEAGSSALASPLDVTLPFGETGFFDPARAEAVGFRFAVRTGQYIRVNVELPREQEGSLFLDLYRTEEGGGKPEPVASRSKDGATLEFEAKRDGLYLLRLQPELLRGGRYRITVTAAPALAFPVQGAGRGEIISVWGDARDGGARGHEGIDIVAPRGTPVVAPVDGLVTRVERTEIGGRVVWLFDRSRSLLLYFAHLDRQSVRQGTWVKAGAELGRVGNSGNAEATVTHLHFGIYHSGFTALNPYFYVTSVPMEIPELRVSEGLIGNWARVAREGGALLGSPSPKGASRGTLARATPLRVLGGTGEFVRVSLPDARSGYLSARLIESADRPLERLVIPEERPYLDLPRRDAPSLGLLTAGGDIEVFGAFGEFLFVRMGDRPAWLPSGPL